MSFFGGFAKGFADGYNADIAAKKAAELEREKYVATLKLKNKLETDQAIDLATVDFGKIIGQNKYGIIELIFFKKIPQFILYKIKDNHEIRIEGKVKKKEYIIQIHHPEFLLNNDEILSQVPLILIL